MRSTKQLALVLTISDRVVLHQPRPYNPGLAKHTPEVAGHATGVFAGDDWQLEEAMLSGMAI